MAKQQTSQRLIYKIHTGRLAKVRWNLALTLDDARRNGEVVTIGDSQVFRWIDELNGFYDVEQRVIEVRKSIRETRKLRTSRTTIAALKNLYATLDTLQFRPDYMQLVIDKPSDYKRACKGFSINGMKYTRLLGTNGGVKCSTIVFVSEKVAGELRKRIENGRNPEIKMIPAKYEAYRALTCSGSAKVSMPNGILVVDDVVTHFKEDVIYLSDADSDEPVMQYIKDFDVELDESDGYGLMLPALAKRWSDELHLGYTMSGANARFAWTKGMMFAFDFIEFAENMAGTYMVRDAWGHEVDIRQVELVLTTSMLKLWKAYDGIEQYLKCCEENHYDFGIAKTSPKELDDCRSLNYQFIQSYDLTDDDIEELIKPTIDEINDVLGMDYRKAQIFAHGKNMTDSSVRAIRHGFSNALLVEPRLFDDPYMRRTIYAAIKNRIDDAKIGVIDVHGNYSIVCGDPYALCQGMFGLEVTGLLKAGEIYNKYWLDAGATELACFRAPMTCHNNIRRVRVADSDEIRHWYQYIETCTLFNAWDTSAQALNGMDKDGDLVMLTDNRVLVSNIRKLPTVMCIQRSGEKIDVTEDSLIAANIASFGDDIGKTTNWITSMFDAQAQFDKDSEEYKTLEYRIVSGQNYQQNCIDKAKGIVCKPMPRYWHDFHGYTIDEGASDEEKDRYKFNRRIMASKKPYFMRYIYKDLNTEYRTFEKNTSMKCMAEFGITIDDLLGMSAEDLTEDQSQFVSYYRKLIPVSDNKCVMNRICHRIEREFDGVVMQNIRDLRFDYSILLTGHGYTQSHYYRVRGVYEEYKKILKTYMNDRNNDLTPEDEELHVDTIKIWFVRKSLEFCSNKNELCDIVLDMCYKSAGSGKRFMWDVVGEDVINNIILQNEGIIMYPAQDPNGSFEYANKRYEMREVNVYGD